jgi:cystathionine beta-lyase
MGLTAAEAAYRDGGNWLQQLLVYLKGNRDFVGEYVAREMPGVSVALPEATYLAWLDCRGTGLAEPCQCFLDIGRVACVDGKGFGPGGEGFVRLNFACPRSMLEQALQRMRATLLA